MSAQILDIEQGTQEWFEFRKKHVTATDASVIMRASHWKTPLQLYHEKLSDDPPMTPNERMQRGIDLEPIARELFNIQTGLMMQPKVLVRDWQMASLDGIDPFGQKILEIKCPGDKDHAIAVSGKIPDHYYPQIQHQMYVSDVSVAYYFSFDGLDGVIIDVKRDDKYIEKMIEEERKFYECLINKTPPEPDEDDYIERNDYKWTFCASDWIAINQQIKQLQEIEEDLRNQLIQLSGQSNTKGAGISLCQVQRKGNVDYSKIPQLKGLDLEEYRKPSTTSWRITCD